MKEQRNPATPKHIRDAIGANNLKQSNPVRIPDEVLYSESPHDYHLILLTNAAGVITPVYCDGNDVWPA